MRRVTQNREVEQGEMMGKRTPLYDRHVALGARMVDFGGWDMPVQYPTGILREHAATRTACGIFDTCHMGEFLFEGHGVLSALNGALSGEFTKLQDGRERYTFIPNEQGGVIDDAVVMRFTKHKAWMVVNAGDIEGDFAAVTSRLPQAVRAENMSEQVGKIDVQGPRAWEVVRAVTGADFRSMPFYSFIEMTWDGGWMVFSRSGYTGEPGAELYVDAGRVGDLWDALLAAGQPLGAVPCGLGSRDTLRLEAGLPLYGHELTVETNPIAAGFDRFVRLDKPEDFPGRTALADAKPQRLLVGLHMHDKRVPRAGFPVLLDGQTIGVVTSGAPGPTVGGNIAMAYVDRPHATAGTEVAVEIRGQHASAVVADLPFHSNPALRERTGG